MTMTRVAAVRLEPRLGEVAANRDVTTAAIGAAAAAGATLVVLPELSSSGYCFADADEARAASETIPGPTTAAWVTAAARHGVVVVGGICEVDGDGALHNSAVVVDAGGVRAVYRKLHLWGRENLVFTAGTERPPVVETAAGRIGLAICYDLWFPALAADLAGRGAEIVAAPANYDGTPPAQDGLPHLNTVVAIATAHVNRVHVVVSDRCGPERGTTWLGGACVVDAHGTLLAGPPPGEQPAMAVADIAPAAARDKRWGLHNDLLGDRRSDVLGTGADR